MILIIKVFFLDSGFFVFKYARSNPILSNLSVSVNTEGAKTENYFTV